MLHLPNVLSPAQIYEVRSLLQSAEWVDGRATAGYLSQRVKHNRQAHPDDPAARAAGALVISALQAMPAFIAAALPAKIVPPLFNSYEAGEFYGDHVDGAVRPTEGVQVRTDLSATLFLSEPDSYQGGELSVRSLGVDHAVKFAAGDMFLYQSNRVHRVAPVTSGVRVAAFFWIQSMVRDNEVRDMLFELDNAIQSLARDVPEHPSIIQLMSHYHNLLRRSASV